MTRNEPATFTIGEMSLLYLQMMKMKTILKSVCKKTLVNAQHHRLFDKRESRKVSLHTASKFAFLPLLWHQYSIF